MAALEQKKSYFVAKDFKGINVTNNRTAIGEGEFAWLENTQPIGFGNVRDRQCTRHNRYRYVC
jgi:hypothetical protein